MEENKLFDKGIKAYNKHSFYDAHEYWEEIWTNSAAGHSQQCGTPSIYYSVVVEDIAY